MIIQVQKEEKKEQKRNEYEDTLALFCFLFPSYTYAEAKHLPYRRIMRMIKVAKREQAYNWYNLLQISIASQTKQSASKLYKEYKKIIES